MASSRTGIAGLALNNVRKLANSDTYDFTEEDWRKVVAFLRGKVDSIEESFKAGVELDEFNF